MSELIQNTVKLVEKFNDEIKSQIEAYKKDIVEKREGAPEKWAHLENELKGGLEKVKGAFQQLLS